MSDDIRITVRLTEAQLDKLKNTSSDLELKPSSAMRFLTDVMLDSIAMKYDRNIEDLKMEAEIRGYYNKKGGK